MNRPVDPCIPADTGSVVPPPVGAWAAQNWGLVGFGSLGLLQMVVDCLCDLSLYLLNKWFIHTPIELSECDTQGIFNHIPEGYVLGDSQWVSHGVVRSCDRDDRESWAQKKGSQKRLPKVLAKCVVVPADKILHPCCCDRLSCNW